MPRRWLLYHSPVVLDISKPAVLPGQAHDFTDEEAEGLSEDTWAKTDPREGRARDREFRRERDERPNEGGDTNPAQPDEEQP